VEKIRIRYENNKAYLISSDIRIYMYKGSRQNIAHLQTFGCSTGVILDVIPVTRSDIEIIYTPEVFFLLHVFWLRQKHK